MTKYKLLKNDYKQLPDGTKVYRIQATKSFGSVKKGEKGGYLESKDNLSGSGDAWVCGNAQVYGNAWVSGNARVCGDARVYDKAWVSGKAWVAGNAQVYGEARVSGNAWVAGNAQVYGNAWVYGGARVYGEAQVYDGAWVYDNAWVYGGARVYGDTQVHDGAWVYGDAWVCGGARVYGIMSCTQSPINIIIPQLYPITITQERKNQNYIAVGCVVHTKKEWLKKWRSIAKKHKVSTKGIKNILTAIKLLAK